MNKTLYFDILKVLSEKGIGIELDIINELSEFKDELNYTKQQKIIDFIAVMEKNNHIISSGYWAEHLDGRVVNAKLTQLGLDYFYSNELRNATIASFKNQRLFNRVSLVFSAVAVVISIFAFLKKDNSEPQIYQKGKDTPLWELKYQQTYPTYKIPDTIYKKQK